MPDKEGDLPSRKERKQQNYAKSSEGGDTDFPSPGQKLSQPFQLNLLNNAGYLERTVFPAKSNSEKIPTHGYVSLTEKRLDGENKIFELPSPS